MRVEFFLDIEPFSVNAWTYARQKIITREAREWQAQVYEQLSEVKALADLAEEWRAQGGVFSIEIHSIYPHHIFYNKQRQISSKTKDVSNVEKPLIDCIFRHMDINDKYIVSMLSTKSASVRPGVNVVLELYAESDEAA